MISKFIKKHFLLLLIVPYVVGTIGMLLPVSRVFFMSLTPLMLVFTFLLVFFEEYKWTRYNVLALVFIFLGGFLVEYIGVNYGYLFGDYIYGTVLGFKIEGVPLTIAMNWAMLCIATRSLVNIISNKVFISALLSAALIAAYDFLLEPVAIKFVWWTWDDVSVPLFNYVCWFGFTFIFQLFFKKVPAQTGRSYIVLFVHAIFYWILLLV